MFRKDGRSLIEIVDHAIKEARERGLERSGQINHAIAAVMTAEPELSHDAADRLVRTLSS